MRATPSILLTLLTAAAAACANAPISYLVKTAQPPESAYACTLRKVNELGYTVTNTNKEAGFITADKQTSGIATQIFTGQQYHDQLTVSIFEAATAGGRQIRATAGRISQRSNIFGTSQQGIAPSDKGKLDANDLLLACGEGPVSKQGALGQELEARARAQH